MAVRILQTEAPVLLANEEKCMAERYDIQPEVVNIPDFWPPRVYDDTEPHMSRQESQALRTTLISMATDIPKRPLVQKGLLTRSKTPEVPCTPPNEMAPPPVGKEQVARGKEKQKPPVLRVMILRLSTNYFATDASEDETDWDDF
jgi:hypothetical protein